MESSGAADACRELYSELEKYEKKGVDIMIDGFRASPLQIVAAHLVKEEGSYMRDYVADDDGNLKSLMFVHIGKENQI